MNNAGKPRQTMDIRKIVVLMIAVLIISVLGATYILFSVENRLVKQYVYDVGNTALYYYSESLDQDLASITEFCQNNFSNTSVTYAYNHRSEERQTKELEHRLHQLMKQLMQQQVSIRLVIYESKTAERSLRQSNFSSIAASDQMEDMLLSADTVKNSWNWRSINGSYYLCNTYELSDGFCTVCLDTSILKRSISEQTDILFTCLQDDVLIDVDSSYIPFTQNRTDQRDLYDSTRNILISKDSSQGRFQICCLVFTVNSWLQHTLRLAFFSMASIMIAAALFLLILARQITSTLQILDVACTQIGAGNLDVHISHQSWLTEAMHIFGTVNTMSEQIRDLKIEIYEHQLSEERTKLSLLRTQIKSHFFINCLNIIHSLATIGNDALIKEFSLCLVDYFRYLGSGFQDTVYLGSELQHLKNYIRIFQIRYPDRVFCSWNIEPNLEDQPILPMIAQTFIENVFTHALRPGKKLHIDIHVDHRQMGQRSFIRMQISDDGPGFSESVLSVLNGNRDMDMYSSQSGHGIGIANVCERMRLYYGDAASLEFKNTVDGGQVILLFPEREVQGKDGSVVDC